MDDFGIKSQAISSLVDRLVEEDGHIENVSDISDGYILKDEDDIDDVACHVASLTNKANRMGKSIYVGETMRESYDGIVFLFLADCEQDVLNKLNRS
jgi:hypothetical protein